MPKSAEIKISARESNGFLIEKYEYSSGAVEPLPFHTHPEYQFSISPNAVGTYIFSRGRFHFPPMTLGIVHSGEKHAPSDKLSIGQNENYSVIYIAPDEVLNAAQEIGWHSRDELPYFKNFTISDRILAAKYLKLFVKGETVLSEAEKRLGFLTYLIENYAQNKFSIKKEKRNLKCVQTAQEFLDANFTRAVSLDELSKITEVGKYYLCREFRRVVGISPHQYQNHLRVNFARRLLLKEKTSAEIAHELGFYDQSHFGKHFKKLVGITPQSYAANIADL